MFLLPSQMASCNYSLPQCLILPSGKLRKVRIKKKLKTNHKNLISFLEILSIKIIKKRILSLQVSTSTTPLRLSEKQELLLQFVRDHGAVRSPLIQKHFKISRARVAQIIKPLLDAGLLLRDGQTRNTQYRLP